MGDIADEHINWMIERGPRLPRRDLPKPPKCKHCGATGLNWQQVKGSLWRLHEGSKPHVCKTTADGFEDEPT